MAEDKWTRSDDEPAVSDALAAGKSELDSALESHRSRIAGYTSAEADQTVRSDGSDPAEPEQATDADAGLAGEELAHDLADPEPFEVVDDEAEELADADEPQEAADEPRDEPDTDLDDLLEGESTAPLDLADLEDDPAIDDEPAIDDPEQLAEAEAVAVAAKSSRPVKRKKTERAAEAADDADDDAVPASRPARKTTSATAPTRKSKPTRSRKEAVPAARTWTSPAQFIRESVAELRKVVWPTGPQVQQYFVVVLVFVLFIIAFVGLLDFGLGWLLLKLLG